MAQNAWFCPEGGRLMSAAENLQRLPAEDREVRLVNLAVVSPVECETVHMNFAVRSYARTANLNRTQLK